MPDFIDPKEFGLPTRTVLEMLDGNTLAIVIDRKSRIVMADGKKIIDKANKLKEVRPGTNIVFKTSAPVCSKTTKFLNENGVNIRFCSVKMCSYKKKAGSLLVVPAYFALMSRS